jgi:hypothetical protein
MEPQTKKRYWLRGGVVALFISLVTFLIVILKIKALGTVFAIIHIVGVLLSFGLVSGGVASSDRAGMIIAYVVSVSVHVFTGFVIGYLYGKFKNRKQ